MLLLGRESDAVLIRAALRRSATRSPRTGATSIGDGHMRAAAPTVEGTTQCDGANIAYEVFGPADAADVLLAQTWQVVHSRHWKLMIPYLSRHYRVVTYDPVGNGKSHRFFDRERYGDRSHMNDALAVLDATGTATAIAVGLSRGGGIATMSARPSRPDRGRRRNCSVAQLGRSVTRAEKRSTPGCSTRSRTRRGGRSTTSTTGAKTGPTSSSSSSPSAAPNLIRRSCCGRHQRRGLSETEG